MPFRKLTLLLIVALLLSACGGSPADSPQEQISNGQEEKMIINFYSGSPGGGWYPIAVALAEIWMKDIPNLEFKHADAGGSGNLIAMEDGLCQVAISSSASIGDGVVGNDHFPENTTKVMGLAALTPEPWAIIVWKDSNIRTFEDMKGKALVPLPKGYTTEAICRRVLQAAGLSYDDFSKVDFVHITEAINLMKDNHTDIFADTIAKEGDGTVVELSLTRPIHIIDIPKDVQEKVAEISPGLFPDIIKAGAYPGVDQDTNVLGQTLALAISTDLSEELVYQMTKAMVENWNQMQLVDVGLAEIEPQDLARDLLGTEFHPGAKKYYQERGWM
ncbi:MAG: TAXI family TRAP transporter solute-binding subunit [Clostridiales bacterium]|nr:TAXI family TRAP transporter solute-binding subunit [Clostridiales bacterium]